MSQTSPTSPGTSSRASGVPLPASLPLGVPSASGAVRLALLWRTSVGKKFLMALTGIILFAYVLAHLLGNLQIYMGAEKIDSYARFLHSNEGMLWTARIVLLAAVLIHATFGLVLWLEKRSARPIPYAERANIQAGLASRTMMYSGLLIFGFVVFHVANLTFGVAVPGYREIEPSVNVPAAFGLPWAAAAYIVAMVGVGGHLWHGLYSMTQSLGFRHPRYTPALRAVAAAVATLIALGNISIPVAVLAGLLG